MDNKKPTREAKATRQAAVFVDRLFGTLSLVNFLSAFAFSVKFFFVTPTPSGIYYGIVSWVCAFGFAMLANFK